MGLQSSRYLTVQKASEGHHDGARSATSEIDIKLRFCLPNEVNRKYWSFLVFKGAFLARLYQLKAKGTKLGTMVRLHSWLDKNLDVLFDKVNMRTLHHFSEKYTPNVTRRQL